MKPFQHCFSLLKRDKTLAFFHNLNPSLYVEFADALKDDEAAIEVLNKLGFIQEAAHIEAMLPPQLQNFSIIKEEETVAAALNDSAFVAAQQAMQSAPNDPNVLTALQTEIAKVMPQRTVSAITQRERRSNRKIFEHWEK